MPEGLKQALEGIIDYAGLFPPAKLPLEDASAEYAKLKLGDDGWVVSKFVCPAKDLDRLAEGVTYLPLKSVSLTVIGTGGLTQEAFREALEADAAAMMRFDEAIGDRAPIEAYEVKGPMGLPSMPVLRDLRAFSSLDVYLELPWTLDMEEALAIVAEEDWLRAKARTGGTEASMFPSSTLLSVFLKSALDLDVAFKLTAGLHEPVHHLDDTLGAPAHGFLNVLAACALHQSHDLTLEEIAEVLDAKQGGALTWYESGLAFKGLGCGWAEIEAARDLFIGFGSCSVAEPIAGLRSLALI